MVEPTKITGIVAGSVSKTQPPTGNKRSPEKHQQAARGVDPVGALSETLRASEARRAAQDVRAQLQENAGVTLGLDGSFDETV